MRSVIIYLGMFLCLLANAQEDQLERAVVSDTIAVSGSNAESFALYLPKDYNADEESFIVFIFDPAGRGSIGIKPFIPAAEKYKMILVCSNNSKNGPFENNLQITDRLFNHVFSNFKIAENGIYTAGFSGGSRLAVTIAVLTNAIQGVIGCGAAFSGSNNHFPSVANTFSYAGLVGDRDMNFQEMQRAGRWLNTMNIENEIFIYEDDHRWPPPAQLLRAFDWLELQAYKKGIKPLDNINIASIFQAQYNRAATFENATNISQAVTEYERTTRNFSPYYNLDSLKSKIKILKKSKSYKRASKDFKELSRTEDTLSFKFSRKFREDVALGQSRDDFKWWKKQLNKLDDNYINSSNTSLKKMGQRIRYQLFALAIESFNGYVRSKDKEKAIYTAKFLEVQDPKNPFYHYRLASGFAKLGLSENVIYHTEAALNNGWDRPELIKNGEEFESVRQDPRFIKLLEEFKIKF